MAILVKALKCATKRFHASHDFTIELAISTFSANARSDPTTAAALSYSERLVALAAVGRGTSRASNNHAAGSSFEAGYFRAGRQAGRAKCFTLLGF